MKVKMKGEEHILVNIPIDTSLKKKAHSAMSDWSLKGRAMYIFCIYFCIHFMYILLKHVFKILTIRVLPKRASLGRLSLVYWCFEISKHQANDALYNGQGHCLPVFIGDDCDFGARDDCDWFAIVIRVLTPHRRQLVWVWSLESALNGTDM